MVIFIITILVLGFLFTIQVRSQATAEKLLSGQDNVTLGLLITGLAQSNQKLVDTRLSLTQQQQKLQGAVDSNQPAGVAALQEQLTQLQVLDGTIAVHGPGVRLHVGFGLQVFELSDLANALRQLGAEAIAVNGVRLTAKSVIAESDGRLTIDGHAVAAPYDFAVIGDPGKLSAGTEPIVGTLKARGDVSVAPDGNIPITAVVARRPFVYSNTE
ncbi:MAG: hypothetical protein QOE92_2468 [Chloroflexota bacterium]|nr:hypothetical protein [Chloroflexota bacterium]